MVDFKHPYTLVILGNLLIALEYLFIMYYVLKTRISIYSRSFMR